MFRELLGEWELTRKIESRDGVSPSGAVTGRATFSPVLVDGTGGLSPAASNASMSPTASTNGSSNGNGHSYDNSTYVSPKDLPYRKLLYAEQGQFVMGSGKSVRVRKEYLYRYDSTSDRLDVYFVEGSVRTYLFHSLRFLVPEMEAAAAALTAAEAEVGPVVEPLLPDAAEEAILAAVEAAAIAEASCGLDELCSTDFEDSLGSVSWGPDFIAFPKPAALRAAAAGSGGRGGQAGGGGASGGTAGARVWTAAGPGARGTKEQQQQQQQQQQRPVPRGWDIAWQATGEHRCREDMHHVYYRFPFEGGHLREFEIKYVVVGPNTHYTSTATYRRPKGTKFRGRTGKWLDV